MSPDTFAIDLKQFKKYTSLALYVVQPANTKVRLALDPTKPKLSAEEKATLQANIQLLRDAIVYFTATGAARGVSGHTGSSIHSV